MRGVPQVSTPSLVTRAGNPNEFLKVHTVALLPIAYESRLRLVGDDRKAKAERDLVSAFAREVDVRIVTTDEVRKRAADFGQRDPGSLGNELGVDGVVVTTVHQFIERDGTAIGSERPASVDFSMRLLRSGSGAEIWRATYHVKDEALSENLLALGERLGSRSVAQFRDAQEMLATGFASAGRDLAEARQLIFQR
jgi:hypothetical protein